MDKYWMREALIMKIGADIHEEMIRRSKMVWVECPECGWEGQIECPHCHNIEECWKCDGLGKIKVDQEDG